MRFDLADMNLSIGGSGAFGYFETTKDISSLTKVRISNHLLYQ